LSVTESSFVAVARLDELRVGYATRHEVGERDVIVTVTERGLRAWDAVCPHAEFLLEPGRLRKGNVLECPMHGACFDVDDGSVLEGPATEPLEPVELLVEDGEVLVRAI
jgi:3-phenylpropionate/trans-cinnamate dioxygenase ferredoxin component